MTATDKSMQEIFNTVYRHLLTQNEKLGTSNDACRYRGPYGLKCAVGILITDEEYIPEMDEITDSTVEGLAKEGLLPERLMPYISILTHLQIVHDDYPVEEWESELNRVAATWKLEVPSLSNSTV